MLIVETQEKRESTDERMLGHGFKLTIFINVLISGIFFKTLENKKWPLQRSFTWRRCLSWADCCAIQMLNNAPPVEGRKFPNLAWCCDVISSRGSRELPFHMCAYGNVMLTSDVKVSITSLTKTCVSWTIAPRRPGQRILFQTLRDFILGETETEVNNYMNCCAF